MRIESLRPDARPSTAEMPHLTPSAVLARPLRRPNVLAIVSLPLLASYLARDEATVPDGFVIETHRAGGHSAPPRGALQLDAKGEPVYGPRDHPDLAKMAGIGLPFWLAGGAAHPERLHGARAWVRPVCRSQCVRAVRRVGPAARPAPGAEDAGSRRGAEGTQRSEGIAHRLPFKVAEVSGTLSDPAVRTARRRVCDLGYLRVPYRTAKGTIGYRCPAEPEAAYLRKGGSAADTEAVSACATGYWPALGSVSVIPSEATNRRSSPWAKT